jgi:hypothetical protein
MRYLTAVLAGFGTALAAAVLWILVAFVMPIALPFLVSRLGLDRTGVGASGAVIGSGSIMLAALVGFAAGFGWMVLRR